MKLLAYLVFCANSNLMALKANLLGYTVSSKQVGATVVKLLILAHPAQIRRQKMMQMFTTSHHSPLS
jgi:hypothetical protein